MRPLSPEQQALAKSYIPKAKALAEPWAARWPRLEDEILSAAYLGLAQAAGSYDPERGVHFATFAALRIVGAIKDMLRKCGPDWLPDGWEDAPDPYGEPGADDEPIEAVESMCRKLPPRHGQVIRLLYLHGYKQTKAARAMGISQPRLCEMHKQALAMLRTA